MSNIRRINLLGAGGCGKSTTAAWLFSELKTRLFSIELVSEFVKFWAYKKYQVNTFDQCYIWGKQMQSEYRFLSAGVKNIITDSPVLLASIYADLYFPEINIGKHLRAINKEYEKQYPSFNIFLERGNKPYVQQGRYQTLDESKKIDELIKNAVLENHTSESILIVNYGDRPAILQSVLDRVSK